MNEAADETADEIRTVAMTGAAAAARTVEVAVRAHQDARERRTKQTPAASSSLSYVDAHTSLQIRDERRSEQADAGGGYDSRTARAARRERLERDGADAESVNARTSSDLMNGTDPTRAAAAGQQRPATRGTVRTPGRVRQQERVK